MNIAAQRVCAWSIVPFVVIYIAAFIGLAGFVPPTSPEMSPADLAAFYEHNRLGIRAGQLIALVTSSLVLVWPAAISAQMARIERGPLPILALIQYVSAAVLCVFFMVCSLVWTVAAYRPDMDPNTLRMLHDTGWLVFVMAYPEYVVQLVCIAAVGLSDKRAQPFLSRPACYFTLLVAIAGTGGGFATFFTRGPFAWNGLFGFWLPVAMFLAWLLFVILPSLLNAIKRQEQEEAGG